MKKIEILGTGCVKCRKLYETADAAAREIKLDYAISKVQDIREIAARGGTTTPVLVIDGRIVHAGSVPTVEKTKELLSRQNFSSSRQKISHTEEGRFCLT